MQGISAKICGLFCENLRETQSTARHLAIRPLSRH